MQFHVAQVGFLNPVLDGIQDAGTNIDRLLKHSGLDKFQLDNPENYVPVHSMYALFDDIKRQEGICDLLDQFAEQIQLVSLSQWGEMIAYTPDVLTAIQMAVKYDRVVFSHERAGFEINGTKAKYWQRFIDKPAIGREQADFINFALAINGFRLAAGSDWAPLEIHFQSNCAPDLDRILPGNNNTKILLNQPATAIVFQTSLLSMPMLGKDAPYELTQDFEMPNTLSNKITTLLDSLQPGFVPNMKLVSDITDSSTRSLQRNLAKESASISQVVDQWRFKKTINFLEDPDVRIKDISEQLGYANVPNFERAFRRWTNTTPNRYRESQ
jgi:AraC-like DNA-binding protein